MTVTFECTRCGNKWSAHSLEVAQECRRCNPIPAATPPAEPTTAEAFATVRSVLGSLERHRFPGWNIEQARGQHALALLERRMREMRNALQMVSEQGINSQWFEGGRRRDMQREVRRALADVCTDQATTKEKRMDHDEARALMEGTATPTTPEHPPEPVEVPDPFNTGPDVE